MSEEHRQKYFPPRPSKFSLYPFYSVKDGDECLKKTLTMSAYTGALGTSFAVLAGLTSTTPDNPALGSNLLIRLTKYSLPMFAAGGMFAATTCAVANIRGKDDPLNHFVAGLTTGSVFGTAFKSQKLGWGLGVTFGLLAFVIKALKSEGLVNIDMNTLRREKAFTEYQRSYFTTRPDPEGDRNL
ncbi:NADH dehydrogenase [ubiquinone] 1 alpha subcomplex subunit 11-like [Littorina saxatilis]|uniref:NADH dehydrogenase [ubiquinone] 1 alpha subcomplex subunit 11 n=1 Tax=Littorina saxatilis TaxID=31220 RepID=A0AAN9B8X2_9CAEN